MESKQKRTALVTGGSSGIGRCTAVALSKAGYIVYEFSRRDVPDRRREAYVRRCDR